MIKRITILVAQMLLFIAVLPAQDVHFSQFNASPILLNPAFSGLNGCDYRIGANFRTQWLNVSEGNTYRTSAVFGDMALGKPTRYSNFAGIGMSFYSDQAGDLNLSTNKVDLSLAYHVLINGSKTQSISAGLYGGLGFRNINQIEALYGDQINPITGPEPGTGGEVLDNPNRLYGDVGAGFIYSYAKEKGRGKPYNFHLGISLAHVNQPYLSFFEDPSERLYLRFAAHGGSAFQIADKMAIMPGFLAMKQGPAFELMLSHWLRYTFDPLKERSTALYFGTMYRWADAVVLGLRADFAGLQVGFSYDINVSKLTPVSQTIGGPEFSLIYTGCFPKRNKPRYCPSY